MASFTTEDASAHPDTVVLVRPYGAGSEGQYRSSRSLLSFVVRVGGPSFASELSVEEIAKRNNMLVVDEGRVAVNPDKKNEFLVRQFKTSEDSDPRERKYNSVLIWGEGEKPERTYLVATVEQASARLFGGSRGVDASSENGSEQGLEPDGNAAHGRATANAARRRRGSDPSLKPEGEG